MSIKRKLIAAITFAFAVVLFTAVVPAQDPNTDNKNVQKRERREMRDGRCDRCQGMGRNFRGGRRSGLMRELRWAGLTEAQKVQVKTIMDARRASMQGSREEIKPILQAKRDGTITAEQQERLNAFKARMKEDAKQTREQVLAILTPEQKAAIEQKKAEMKQKREQFRQMRENKKPQTENKPN